ncbi:MAG: hypothetical protein ABI343_01170, partial [Burkholderiaceae bacterium]
SGGFTATVAGNVVTIKAPLGSDYNGLALSIADGTSQTPLIPGASAVTAVPATALIKFSGSSNSSTSAVLSNNLSSPVASIKLGGNAVYGSAITIGKSMNASGAASAVVTAIGVAGPVRAYVGGNSITPTCKAQTSVSVCLIDTTNFSNGSTVQLGTMTAGTFTATTVAGAGGVAAASAVTQSGFTNFKPALATTLFTGGSDAIVLPDDCKTAVGKFTVNLCNAKDHVHQYDDLYDVTGVNMLNASTTNQNLVRAIPSTTTKFKVLMQNQYLSPAVKLHIGNPSYIFDVDAGYVRVKDYQTTSTLDVTALPTYSRATTATATSIPIGSLALNMPTDALTARDWWGNGDVRAGLHPTVYSCAYSTSATNGTDGNMYQPVIPPPNGVDGPGTAGWDASSMPGTWPVSTATGARHNGALTVQIIAADTPQSALEQSLPGRPEYGWRVRSADYGTYVLAEYTMYWHHPNGKCYSKPGWTKTPGADPAGAKSAAKAPGSTDPKIGDLGIGAGSITGTVTTVAGNVTTTVITYSSGLTATIVRTANNDSTITIVTTDTTGAKTTQTVADVSGTVKTGGDERGLQAKTGRISWRELVAP